MHLCDVEIGVIHVFHVTELTQANFAFCRNPEVPSQAVSIVAALDVVQSCIFAPKSAI